ncbi:MAG: aldo/keto reductase [Succinivibrio sp.]|nr:aldo/keto reductase [Succinivibrio sp.]
MDLHLESTLTLNNGVKMPRLGLGVFNAAQGEETRSAVRTALEFGYRLIDTARVYCNERSVGRGILDSGVKREEIFVTTKLWKTDYANPREGLLRSLERLQLKYVDLLLLHWPFGDYVKAYKDLEHLQDEGLCRCIGVSNFREHHLEDLFASGILRAPQVNQTEIHPVNTEEELCGYCQARGIVVEAYSPLGGHGRTLIDDPRFIGMRDFYHKDAAQIILRWALQRGLVAIPKSVRPERIISNSKLFDFELSPGDMSTISDMNINDRRNYSPDKINERPSYLEPKIVDEP